MTLNRTDSSTLHALLGATARVYLAHFVAFTALTIVALVPGLLWEWWCIVRGTPIGLEWLWAPLLFLRHLVGGIIAVFVAARLDGRAIAFSAAFDRVCTRFWGFVGLTIASIAAIATPLVIVRSISQLLGDFSSIGSLLGMALAGRVLCGLSIAVPILLYEQASVRVAFKESIRRTRRVWLSLLGALIVCGLVAIGLFMGAAVVSHSAVLVVAALFSTTAPALVAVFAAVVYNRVDPADEVNERRLAEVFN